MRSDNLRPAPGFFTPELVRSVLNHIDNPRIVTPCPVEPMAQPKPTLRIVSETPLDPPSGGKIRSGKDGPKEEPRAVPRQSSGAARAVPAESAPPILARVQFSPRPAKAAAKRKLRANAKYPDWTPDEDRQLREVYAAEGRVDLLAKRLGRTERAATSRARKLGIMKPRRIRGGWCVSAAWTPEEDSFLREQFKDVPVEKIAGQLGRSKHAVYCRAHVLDLTGQQWSGAHRLALRIAFERGIAIKDVAIAVGRTGLTVSKYATRHGMHFGRRSRLVVPITVEEILALRNGATPTPLFKRDIYSAPRPTPPSKRPISSTPKQKSVREATHRTPSQNVRSAAPREPAPHSPARAQSSWPCEKIDRASARQRAAVRRRIEREATALLDGDNSARSTGGRVNSVVAAAMIELRYRRAAEARAACPIEQAKLILRRRFAPVCSMAVYGGDADLFIIGRRKDVTRDELLELAARYAA